MKSTLVTAFLAVCLLLAGCCGLPSPKDVFGANGECRNVYKAPACASGEGHLFPTFTHWIETKHEEVFKCQGNVEIVPEPVSATPSGCDVSKLPADAKPGEVYCCVFVQPPAAPPVAVEVEPARTEWQKIDCPPADGLEGECYALVVVPARVEMKVSAPPPGYWEWRRNPACEAQNVGAPPCR